jgi:hypothetical protein
MWPLCGHRRHASMGSTATPNRPGDTRAGGEWPSARALEPSGSGRSAGKAADRRVQRGWSWPPRLPSEPPDAGAWPRGQRSGVPSGNPVRGQQGRGPTRRVVRGCRSSHQGSGGEGSGTPQTGAPSGKPARSGQGRGPPRPPVSRDATASSPSCANGACRAEGCCSRPMIEGPSGTWFAGRERSPELSEHLRGSSRWARSCRTCNVTSAVSGCAHCTTVASFGWSPMRGEPLLVASCNMLANLSRSKPSRWWETTRAERDRSVGSDRPKEVLLREWTR